MAAERSLADWFAHLQGLDASARAEALAGIPETMASRLRALLAADDADDERIVQAIAAAPRPDLAEDWTGREIGPWRVLGELGHGGMGTVLLGERLLDGTSQRGAIKLMRGLAREDERARFRQERQILAALDHPGIARLIDGGETSNGQPYLVVEFVRGETLAQRLKSNPPDLALALSWIERIATAVQHAHQNLVVHRDLKPANVMVTPEGDVKLLDFGVAKLLEQGAGGDHSTRVFTPGYAAPEQMAGRPVGTAADIYSLGRMLDELRMASPKDRELAAIAARATAEDPEDRYPTMAAFREDLVHWRLGLPVRAANPGWFRRVVKHLRRHPWGTLAGTAALLVIAVLAWRWIDALSAAAAERDRAETARAAAERQLARSRAVVDFYARMFEGVAPEHALGQALAPVTLLERAERLLAAAPPEDATLRGELSASLGALYQRLGDGTNAVRLLQQALEAPTDADAHGGLQRADREQLLAIMLFDLARHDEALAAAERAKALRLEHAPDDLRLHWISELELVHQYVGLRQLDAARAARDRAEQLFAAIQPLPLDRIERAHTLAQLALDEGRFDAVAAHARDALATLDADPGLPQPRRIELERMQARALQGLGRLTEAEAAFARAIDAQRQYVGDRGTRAMSLYNDHAVLLATLGRFADAIAAYGFAAEVYAASGGPAPEVNPRHRNNLCDAETGMGRYAPAIAHCEAALALLVAEGRPDTDPERLLVESNLARALGHGGSAPEALRRFASLRERAAASQGEAAFPVTLQDFRTIRVALLAGDLAAARAAGQRAETAMMTTFSAPHPWRVRTWRALARVAIAEGNLALAEERVRAGTTEAEAVLPEGHPLRAQLALDAAVIARARGDRAAAASALEQALPGLRACCAANEVDRAEAERMAAVD